MISKIKSMFGFRPKTVVGIDEVLLTNLCDLGQNYHPNEALCFLTGTSLDTYRENSIPQKSYIDFDSLQDQYVLTEYYIIPETKSGPTSATVNPHNIPITGNIMGTFHTHPNGTTTPSSADKNMFHRYSVNIIMGAPYSTDNWKAYNVSGDSVDRIKLPVFSNLQK